MRTVASISSVNSYWDIIKHLSPEAKIDLITLLSQSLKVTMPHTE